MGIFGAIALIIVAYWFFRSPMCGAITDSIRRHSATKGMDPQFEERLEEEIEQLREAISVVRGEVVELAERVDFTERALIGVRQRDRLPSPPAR